MIGRIQMAKARKTRKAKSLERLTLQILSEGRITRDQAAHRARAILAGAVATP